ncbi:glycosyltransferase family protein [Spongiimicrobium salis]|uniref:hypothetical protein n=1 Tax=Spongiimicrobium salis TaxID=1667022 RepID=UPI00374DEBEA
MTKKPCILIIGDAVATTGFARVIYEIFVPLKEKFNLVQLGTNYFGDPHDWPWRIFPAGIDQYALGAHRIKPLVASLQPDLVFMLQDPWALVEYFKELSAFKSIPTVVYASFNSGNIDTTLPPLLKQASYMAVYTQFAKKALKEAIASHPKLSFPKIDVIPHGVDCETFKPLGENRSVSQKIARQAIYPVDNTLLQDGFIVLNANRNQPRKRIDLCMEGFGLFAKNKPEGVFLHLHMGLKDIGWDIKGLARRYQLEDRLIYSTDENQQPQVTDSMLNTIFNAASIGINTASSEGWGLLSFEQAAAGLAQIVPAHSSGKELWNECAYLLPYDITLVNPHSKINEHIIKPASIAEVLEQAWGNSEELQKKEKQCYLNAQRKAYRWYEISKYWEGIFNDQLEKKELKKQNS